MMNGSGQARLLQKTVQATLESRMPLNISGGDSKTFYGRTEAGEPLALAGHRGVINYRPSELVMTDGQAPALPK